MKGFLMKVGVAEEFFKRCIEKEAGTIDERMKIMHQLLHEENIKIVKESQIKELVKGKTVLVVDCKRKHKNV